MANSNEEPTGPTTREEAPVEAPAESPATHKYVCKWSNPFRCEHKNYHIEWTNLFRFKHKIYHIATVSSAFALIEFLISAFYCPDPPQTTRRATLFWTLKYAVPVIYSGISQIIFAASSFHSSKHPVVPAVLCGCTLTAYLGLIWYKTMLTLWHNIEPSFTGAGAGFNWIGEMLVMIVGLGFVLFQLPAAWYGFQKEWQPKQSEHVELGSPA